MQSIAPAKNIQIKSGTAEGIVKVIKNATHQSNHSRALKQAIRMAEMSDDKLSSVAGKMSEKEKQNMLKSLRSLGRVIQAIQVEG